MIQLIKVKVSRVQRKGQPWLKASTPFEISTEYAINDSLSFKENCKEAAELYVTGKTLIMLGFEALDVKYCEYTEMTFIFMQAKDTVKQLQSINNQLGVTP